ncbi:MAG: NAD(P)-dependent glycerol-3-phosphate dehydrogenase [Chloroflexi bacterium]|nr:NAD(P)-dependent glycerol-3-phosphate dehydrogenase [Chloroflexota bacterium]
MTQATVIGTTSWGTTLAVVLARNGVRVWLWARGEAEAKQLRETGENTRLLPGVPFPTLLTVTNSLEEALNGSTMVILAVPSQTMRENVGHLRGLLSPGSIILSATKGLEVNTAQRMSQVIAEGSHPGVSIAVLSGPNLGREIARGLPAATVVAATDDPVAREVQRLFISPNLRVYTNSDVIGVELGGALKNIIAIGAGMCDGWGFGDNAKAALITRGLAEMTRLGVAAGANPLTFAGLAGMGDLVATCSSPLSRNHQVGEQLAWGRPLPDIIASLGHVAEGISTTRAASRLAQEFKVEMPIINQTYRVLFQGLDPRQAAAELLAREPKAE